MSNSPARSPQAQIVVDAIDRLPPTQRALLNLSVRHAMDDEEIGAIVGLDPHEVTRLRERVLDRMGGELSETDLGSDGNLAAALEEVASEQRIQPATPAGFARVQQPTPQPAAPVPETPGPGAVAQANGDLTTPAPAAPAILTGGAVRRRRRTRPAVLLAAGAVLVAVVGAVVVTTGRLGQGSSVSHHPPRHAAPAAKVSPPLPQPTSRNIYAADRAGNLSPVVRNFHDVIYVPSSRNNTVDVIAPHTFRIVDHFDTGALPQHVTPSWNLKKLWVLNDVGNSLTPIDPRTGHHGKPVPVEDPYNMYYTPNGRYAIVVAEQLQRLDFRNPKNMKLHRSIHVPCLGVDHMDFTADGAYLLASCEFSGQMVVVDVNRDQLVKTIQIQPGAMPQDVKLSPDGRTFYVADMASNGVWVIGAKRFRLKGFIRTGRGAHGLYASRDARQLYVSNRGEGSISVISFRKQRVVERWQIPGGGSPDMGGVSTDGKVLWLSGRYDAEVYAISTEDGHLIKRIKVGLGPHGLCVYPQPGRYSLGHTGVFR